MPLKNIPQINCCKGAPVPFPWPSAFQGVPSPKKYHTKVDLTSPKCKGSLLFSGSLEAQAVFSKLPSLIVHS